jgi:hypothetical protein
MTGGAAALWAQVINAKQKCAELDSAAGVERAYA